MTIAARGVAFPGSAFAPRTARGPGVQDITALKAIVAGERFDKMLTFVEDELIDYHFDAQSAAAESLPDIVQPDVGTGRWFRASTSGGLPAAHALAGAEHTADTLANLNAKVSDATLIDTGDARLSDDRDPTLHAGDHSKAGTDPITVENLATSEVSTTKSLMSDGAGGLVFGAAIPATHGSSHISTGGDPIPDAVPAGASGLFSGADKTKLDGIGALANVTSVFGRTGVVVKAFGDYAHLDLSGIGTDDHHNENHGLGDAVHAPTTLSGLNAKVSDATLDDVSGRRGVDATIALIADWDTGAQGILTDFIQARSGQSLIFKEDDGTVIISIIPGGSVIIAQDLDPGSDASRSIGDGTKRWRRIFGRDYPSVDETVKILIEDTGLTLLSKDSAAGASVKIAQTDGAAPVSSATALDSRKLVFEAELWDITPLTRTGSIRFQGDGATDDQGQFTFSSDDQGGSENDFLHVFRDTFGDAILVPTGSIRLKDSAGAQRLLITTAGVKVFTDQAGPKLEILDAAGVTRLEIFEQDTDSVSIKIGVAAGSIIFRDAANAIMLRINGNASKIVHHVKLEPNAADTILIGLPGLAYKQINVNIIQPGPTSLLFKDATGTTVVTVADAGDMTLSPTGNVIITGELIPEGTSGVRSLGSGSAGWQTAFVRKIQPNGATPLQMFTASAVLAFEISTTVMTFNKNGNANLSVLFAGDDDSVLLTTEAVLDRVGVGVALTSHAAKLHVKQNLAAGAIPVLVLEQDDDDETFLNFIGTSAADGTKSISSDTTEDDAKVGAVRVELNGTLGWVRIFAGES